MTERESLALWLPEGQVTPPVNPYGRLIANAGVYRALVRYGRFRQVHVQSRMPPTPEQMAAQLGATPATEVTTGPLFGTAAAVRAGTLLSGQPYLTEPAWVRRQTGKDDAYSIVGTIFAFASATHREQMLSSLLAPLHEWDALICSSPSLATTVERTLDVWEDHLRERFEAPDLQLPRPHLPVIGFGTDVDTIGAQSRDVDARRSMRASLGIAEADVMAYFLGRLSYYDKAFPQAMFAAVQGAQARTGVTTHFVLAGWFPLGDDDLRRFEQAARSYAPDVAVHFLDGNDPSLVAQCWAAADIFLLLSDTILETFGQALVEAMAAGLPLVVSDWDGYRWIVRHGVDGFLIPTLGAPAGPLGESLGLLQQLGLADFAQFAGSVSAHTAVHVGRATEALSRLVASADLRQTMGAAARTRAREVFAWPVIAAQYLDLFDDLTERRLAAGVGGRDRPVQRTNPLRGDPFADFRALPTQVLDDDLVVRLAPGVAVGVEAGGAAWAEGVGAAATGGEGVGAAATGGEGVGAGAAATGDAGGPVLPGTELDRMYAGLRGNELETWQVIDLLAAAGEVRVREVLAAFPATRRRFIRMTLVWLAKAGMVDWLPPA